MSTEEDRTALAVELREVYLRTPGNRGMDAPRWVAVADAAIAALHHPAQGDYYEGIEEGIKIGRAEAVSAPRVTDEMVERAAYRYWLESSRDSEGDLPQFDWEKDEREQFMWAARIVIEAALGVSE